jgi:hypothetical protein
MAEEGSPNSGSPLRANDVARFFINSPVEAGQVKVETNPDEGDSSTLTPGTPSPVARAHERTLFHEPVNLPSETLFSNDDQIIQLMYCAPNVRKKYIIHFDRYGYLKNPWRRSVLFEMNENGETRHPMSIIRSNVANAPVQLAGIRRRAQAAKDLEKKRTHALSLERQLAHNMTPNMAKRSQDLAPDPQTGPKAKKRKPSSMSQPARDQLAWPGGARQGAQR